MLTRFKNFEIRKCKEPNNRNHLFELVKWYEYEGREVCYVVAFIDWNSKEQCWEFKSVGLRYVEDYEEGLSEYVLAVLKLLEIVKNIESEEN